MPWTIFGLLIMMLLILTSTGVSSRKKKELFLNESQELKEMKGYAKEKLASSNELFTIRAITKKYELSLSDAKKIMDFAKKASIQE